MSRFLLISFSLNKKNVMVTGFEIIKVKKLLKYFINFGILTKF